MVLLKIQLSFQLSKNFEYQLTFNKVIADSYVTVCSMDHYITGHF